MQPHQGKERVLGVKTRETEEERTIADKKWTLEGTAQCHKAGEIGGLQLMALEFIGPRRIFNPPQIGRAHV